MLLKCVNCFVYWKSRGSTIVFQLIKKVTLNVKFYLLSMI